MVLWAVIVCSLACSTVNESRAITAFRNEIRANEKYSKIHVLPIIHSEDSPVSMRNRAWSVSGAVSSEHDRAELFALIPKYGLTSVVDVDVVVE